MIVRRFSVVDSQIVKPVFALLLFCGLALVLSIPSGEAVKDFGGLAAVQRGGIYFYVYIFFSGVLGLSLGTLAAIERERGRALYIHTVARVGIAQAVLIPYFIFARALYPGREAMPVLMLLYGILISLLMSLVSRLIEESGHGASPSAFIGKYVAFAIYYAVPLIRIPLLSPLGFVNRLFWGGSVLGMLLGFLVPIALVIGALALCGRHLRGRE